MGIDPWLSFNDRYRLSKPLVVSLRHQGVHFLYQLAAPVQAIRWSQSWQPVTDFVLTNQEEVELNLYIGALGLSMIKLREEEDVLIWNGASCGKYTPKEGYIYLSAQNYELRTEWWWQKIWKFHCPPKMHLFWWCVLENKVPC